MGELGAMLARGMPPSGRGVFVRDRPSIAASIGASFACVNGVRSDVLSQIEQLGGAWLYSTPESWRPESWRAGAAHLLEVRARARAAGLSVHGIIANPENGWPELSGAERDAEARALGAHLGSLSSDMRVGCVSFPLLPSRGAMMDAAGDGVWWSPELYGQSSGDPAVIRRWWDDWTGRVGASRCIPSIAGWNPAGPGVHDTAATYRAYLEHLPAAAGYIAWTGAGGTPPHIVEGLRSYSPGGSELGTVVLALRNAALRPVAVGVALVLLGFAVLFGALAGWARK